MRNFVLTILSFEKAKHAVLDRWMTQRGMQEFAVELSSFVVVVAAGAGFKEFQYGRHVLRVSSNVREFLSQPSQS